MGSGKLAASLELCQVVDSRASWLQQCGVEANGVILDGVGGTIVGEVSRAIRGVGGTILHGVDEVIVDRAGIGEGGCRGGG